MHGMLQANILLASHDSPGARAAEKYALEHCQANSSITHFIVVPEFWKGMLGDDWLNTSKTRRHFTHYLESTLNAEIDQHISRLSLAMEEKSLHYQVNVKSGDPLECLLAETSSAENYDMVIMGSQRPRRVPGLRSRMLGKKLFRQLHTPLLVIPFPT